MSMSALLREGGTLPMCLLVAQASTKSREGGLHQIERGGETGDVPLLHKRFPTH